MKSINSDSSCKKVMLIDDNEIDLFVHETILLASSFALKVIKENSAVKALEELKKLLNEAQLPDLIFLDLNMPVMTGFDFLKAFEALPADRIRSCKIVVLTSSALQEDMKSANEYSSVVKYLRKPLDITQLNEVKSLVE